MHRCCAGENHFHCEGAAPNKQLFLCTLSYKSLLGFFFICVWDKKEWKVGKREETFRDVNEPFSGGRGKEGKNFCRFYPDEKRAWRFAFRAFRFWANLEDKEKKNWNSQEREKNGRFRKKSHQCQYTVPLNKKSQLYLDFKKSNITI